MTAREEIISAIRATKPVAEPPNAPRFYRTTLALDRAGLIALLSARLADYGVTVTQASPAGLQEAAAARFAARGVRHVLVPAGLPGAWYPPGLHVADGLPAGELNQADGAMTGCLLAIAETGTIVLDGGSLSGRRALTLLPDYHLCVVDADQIVGLLPEAMPALWRAVAAGPLTFFSGPSATADIELERVAGVHGPRTLDVIIVSGP